WTARAAFFRSLLGLADRLVCPSSYVAEYFEAEGPTGLAIDVIPNGVVVGPDREELVVRQDTSALRLAYVGSVVKHKGVHVILEALERSRLQRVELRVLGGTDDRGYTAALEERAKAIPGLTLRLLGAYAQDELPRLLSGVDCVVAPSQIRESFSLTVREALGLGIPVVAARRGALAEAIVEGENGLTFAHDSSDELATILRRLSDEPRLMARLATGARGTGISGWESHADRTRSVYRSLVPGRHGRRPDIE